MDRTLRLMAIPGYSHTPGVTTKVLKAVLNALPENTCLLRAEFSAQTGASYLILSAAEFSEIPEEEVIPTLRIEAKILNGIVIATVTDPLTSEVWTGTPSIESATTAPLIQP